MPEFTQNQPFGKTHGKTTWKAIYLWVKAAVLNLDSVDALLRQIVEKITVSYRTDCLLWTGLELGISDTIRVYTTTEVARRSLSDGSVDVLGAVFDQQVTEPDNLSIQQFCPRSLPLWFLDQQYFPQIIQIESGDIIILSETHLEEAVEVAERLRHSIRSNPVRSKAGLLQFTASFGAAQQNPLFDRSAWDVLQRADAALYEAKRQGRDRVESLDLP